MFFRVIKPLLPLIPIGLIAVAVVIIGLGTVRVRRGAPRKAAFTSAALDVLLGASLVSVLVLTLPPSIDTRRSAELVPFRQGFHDTTAEMEMLANIVLFVPLGVFAPARWFALDTWSKVVPSALGLSATIETLQFTFDVGRQASVTDLILNTLGAAIGYLLLRVVRRLRRRLDRADSGTLSG